MNADFHSLWQNVDWDRATSSIYEKTTADVEQALAAKRCSLDDFMALISPAATAYLEPMAQKPSA